MPGVQAPTETLCSCPDHRSLEAEVVLVEQNSTRIRADMADLQAKLTEAQSAEAHTSRLTSRRTCFAQYTISWPVQPHERGSVVEHYPSGEQQTAEWLDAGSQVIDVGEQKLGLHEGR
jgi:hypothetical protein